MEKPTRNLGDLLSLVKYPLITEKSTILYGNRQYTFLVDKSLTKIEIKYVLEKVFNVTITGVKTCILPMKTRRVGRFLGKRSLYKKIFIKLKEGDSIAELFD